MSLEKYNNFTFERRCHDVPGVGHNANTWVKGYFYVIYNPNDIPTDTTIIRESHEYFDSASEAKLAAIGHITLLEEGEG